MIFTPKALPRMPQRNPNPSLKGRVSAQRQMHTFLQWIRGFILTTLFAGILLPVPKGDR
jgi:hypothetical protein